MRNTSLSVAAALASLISLAASARAQTPPSAAGRARVAVLEFLVEAEDKSPALALQLQDGFVVGLTRTGITVLDSVAVGKRLEATPELQKCDTAICLRQLGQALAVRHVARVRVTVEGNSYKMTARLFGTEDAAAAVVVPRETQSRFCDVCTVAEAREMMIRLGESMRRPVDDAPVVAEPASPPPAPRESSRTGAVVSLIAGVAAVATGAVLLTQADSNDKPAAALAGGLMGAGAAVTTVGLYLAFDGAGERKRPAAGVSVAVRF